MTKPTDREKQIEEAANKWFDTLSTAHQSSAHWEGFKVGAEWADKNPNPVDVEFTGNLLGAINSKERKIQRLESMLKLAVGALNEIHANYEHEDCNCEIYDDEGAFICADHLSKEALADIERLRKDET